MPKPDRRAATFALVLAVALVSALTAFGVNKEIPVTPVSGTVTMFENKKPLPKAFVTFSPEWQDGDEARHRDYTVRTDENGKFKFRRLPTGNYNVWVRGTAHDVQQRMVAVVEGKANRLDFEAVPRDPQIQIALSTPVFLPDEPIKIKSSGYLTERSIKLTVWRIEPERIRDSRNLTAVLTGVTRNRNPKDPATVADGPVVHQSEGQPQMIDLEGAFTTDLTVPKLPRGVYRALASSKGANRYFWFTVTDLGLVTKTGDKKATTWAVGLRDGKPRPNVKIDLVTAGGVRPAGTTDANGLVTVDVPVGHDDNTRQAMLMASDGENRAYTWWNRYNEHDSDVAWTVTDRPVYRAGDTVFFKTFIRHPVGAQFGPASLKSVNVELRGPDGDTVATMNRQVAADGRIDGSFKIEAESPTGSYEISLTSGDWSDSHFFPVAQYRKPEYDIKVSPAVKAAYRGDTVPVTVQVNTYTGEPAVSAKVQVQVYRKEVYWEGDEGGFGDTDYAEFVKTEDLTTDAQGRATVNVSTSRPVAQKTTGWSPPDAGTERYEVKVDVTGTGDRYYSGSGSFNVYQGDLDLQAEADNYAANSGQPFRIRVTATGRKSGSPATGTVAVALTRLNYERTDQEAEEGEPAREVRTNYAVVTGQLDARGQGVLDVVPDKPGDYEAVVSIKDSHGRTVESVVSFWVPGDHSAANVDYLNVTLDKHVYHVTDRPTAVVRSDAPGVPVLVTVETDEVTWTKVVPMPSDSAEVKLPGLAATPSGASVSVCRVSNKDMQSVEAQIRIGARGKRLKVQVAADKAKAKPGDDVGYTISTTDESGRPVSADLAFSVVDEAVYAIREDANDPLQTFYPERYSSVQTTWSFPSIYFDGGDKSPADVKVRRDFKDTAFWSADLRTGPDGTARVHVRLPDNLTEWRATVCAVTADAAVGKGKSAVVATQDLMARLSLPPFMVQSDVQQVSATLTNTTEKPLQVQVDLELQGAKSDGALRQVKQVGADSTEVLTWNLEAGNPGDAVVKLTATTASGPADAVEMKVPVHTNGRPSYWHAGGIVGGPGRPAEAGYVLEVPANATTGALDVRVAPGLAGTLLSHVDELVAYPYGCVEQTLSRMVPAVLTQRTLARAGYVDADLDTKVDEVLRRGFARLRDMRQYGGGWGWFRNDQPDPWVTAVALESFRVLKQEGVAVKEDWVNADIEWAVKYLATPPRDTYEARRRLQLAAALAGHTQRAGLLKAIDDVFKTGIDRDKKLGAESLAWTALAYSRLSRSEDANVASAAKAQLPPFLQRLEAAAPHSVAEGADYGTEETVAYALVAIEPDSALTSDVVYRLATPPVRSSMTDTWLLHRSVGTIAAYLARHPEQLGSGEAEVIVNGNAFARLALGRPSAVRVPLSGLAKGKNSVQVKVSGGATASYALDYKGMVFEPDAKPLALSSGFSITRTYHKMELGTSDGVRRLVPASQPSTTFQSGEVYRVRLTVRNSRTLRYVAIEDYVPSNARTVELDRTLDGNNDWGYWWCGADFRDDRTVYFSRELAPGEHVLEYAVRAESPGTCYAPPATAYPMYDPGMVVRTGTGILKVTPK
ncbi:MAG: carboxypeptidase regulatory-like domain-containing protein [Fimbriimonadaceae bacterium]|nr:carboxypeptidase regulatory-like domain-containing protein [Fimbriimonadaceae bacterium]